MKTWIIFRHFRFRYHRYHSWKIQETESRTLLPGTRTWAQCPSTTSTLDLNVIHCCDFSHGKRTDAPRRNRTCLHRSWQSHHKDLATKKKSRVNRMNIHWTENSILYWISLSKQTLCVPVDTSVHVASFEVFLQSLDAHLHHAAWKHSGTSSQSLVQTLRMRASGRWNPATWLFWWDSHHFI